MHTIPYKFLLFLIAPYYSLQILAMPDNSLLFLTNPYYSLQILTIPYKYLLFLANPYNSLQILTIPYKSYKSLQILAIPYQSLLFLINPDHSWILTIPDARLVHQACAQGFVRRLCAHDPPALCNKALWYFLWLIFAIQYGRVFNVCYFKTWNVIA